MNYRIEWTIDVTADDPVAAAREALVMQRDPASMATVFDVTPIYDRPAVQPATIRVDLTEQDAPCEHIPHNPDVMQTVCDVYLEDGDGEPTRIDLMEAGDTPVLSAEPENHFAAALAAFETQTAKHPPHPEGEDEDEDEPVWLDIPTPACATNDPNASWVNIGTFPDRPQALAFAQEHFDADERGRICILSGGPGPVTPAPPVTLPVCPKCGGNSVTIHVDAEATYELKGWDQAGEIAADFNEPGDVHTYDYRTYGCDDCSYQSTSVEDFDPNTAA